MQRCGVVGLAPGEESVLRLQQAVREVGECTVAHRPTQDPFYEYVDSGSQGKKVKEVDVVVTTCRPRLSQVQKLKREICSVGGNEILQEACAFLPVGPLSI